MRGAVEDSVLTSARGSSDSPQKYSAVEANMSRPRVACVQGRAVRNSRRGDRPPSRTTAAATYATLRPSTTARMGTSATITLASESVQMNTRLAAT